MKPFSGIRARAAQRHGGEARLMADLPEVSTADALAAIPDDRWLAGMTKRVFQSGFSWQIIEDRWPGFERAFDGFRPGRVALYGPDDMERLLADTGIVRNGQNIKATVANAVFVADLATEHGSAAQFFAHWPDDDFVGLLEVLKKRGSRLGGNTGQIFLRYMGRDSFVLSKDVKAALVEAGVVAKPPTSKRDLAAVQAAFNAWRAETGLPLTHLSRILALSIDG